MAVGASRGQVQTLEGVVAALLVLSSLVFALQTTAVTPLSASTASQHIENQQQSRAEGILATTIEQDQLKPTLLYWDETNDEFHGAGDVHYEGDPPRNDSVLFEMLEDSFGVRGIAYNVYAVYFTSDGDMVRQRVRYVGRPSDNAVTSSRLVTLYQHDHLRDPLSSGVNSGGMQVDGVNTLDSTPSFFAPDAHPAAGDGLYNVIRVEVVVWRI